MANEVFEQHVADSAAAAVALDHHDLVRVDGVDVAVDNVGNVGAGAERAKSAAAGPVAPDVFDKDILRGRLDGDTLVFIGNGDLMECQQSNRARRMLQAKSHVVHPNIGRPNINAV